MSASMQRQRGVALMVALLVVALATILVAALLDRGELALARTRNALRAQQAEAYAQGLDAYAASILLELANEGTDTNASPWATPLPPQTVPGGSISAVMRDRNGCFNLNNLAPGNPLHAKQWRPVFRNLLGRLGASLEIGPAVEAWLDADSATRETGAYLAQPLPYRPRGGLFAHVSELRLVRGVDGDTYARLAPHVCALPGFTRINVNTATVPVLAALTGKTQAEAERLWNGGQAHFGSGDDFLREAGVPDGDVPSLRALIAVNSTHFLVQGDVVLDTVPFTFYSLIERRQGIRVLQRSRGADLGLAGAAPIAAGGSR